MRRLASLFLFLCVTSPTWAQIDAEYNTDWLKEPYQLQLVIYAEPHPLLTNVFVDQFAREVGDSLQRDLGRTTKVSTLIFRDSDKDASDMGRQMMEAVIERGWAELDGMPKQIHPNKIHLIRLFYVDGEYEVQSRQVDGDTGIISPLRKSRTTDRQWVMRQAAMQLAQDFGIVGEIVNINNLTIKIRIRGFGLGVPETIRMAQGEAMAVSQVRRGSNGYTSFRLPETLAYITNVDAVKGEVTARVYFRGQQNPLIRDRQTVAFRVIKLGTRVVPLNMRVLDQESNPINGYSISHFPSGYENGGGETLGTTDPQGRIMSKDPIYHVAFVRVQVAGVGKIDTPVALLDDQPVVIRIAGNRDAIILDDTKFEYERWMKRYNQIKDDYEVDRKLKFSDLMKQSKTAAAIKNLQEIIARLKENVEELKPEFTRIVKASQDNKQAQAYVDSAQKFLKLLSDAIVQEEELVKMELNPTEDLILLKRAKQAEADLDFDDAIKLYKESLGKNKNQPKVIAKVKALEGIWKTGYRDRDHVEARTFALNVWTSKTKTLTWEEISKEIGNAENYFVDLEKRGDYLTVLVLIKGDLKHIKTLNAALDALGNAEENQEKVAIVEKTRKALIDFDRRAQDYATKAINEDNK